MPPPSLQLRFPKTSDEACFRAAVAEFQKRDPQWNFAFCWEDQQDFPGYVKRISRWPLGEDLPEDFVTNSFLLGVVGETIVGRISIRHELNPFLETYGGHIGYCVLPSKRNRGYASAMLSQSLVICRSLGLEQVLVTCDEDNPASKRVIEKNGGHYENTVMDKQVHVAKLRYWIDTTKSSPQ